MNLLVYENFLSENKARIQLFKEKEDTLKQSISTLEKETVNLKEAQEIVSVVGVLAQENIKKLVECLVTHALQAVFGKEYSFELESRISRNKPEMEMFVSESGVKYSPKDEKGGGIIDVISFALRVVLWTIREPKSENVLILDEPFKMISPHIADFLGEMLKEISQQLGLQIVMVTQNEVHAEKGDCRFYVRKINGVSSAEKLN